MIKGVTDMCPLRSLVPCPRWSRRQPYSIWGRYCSLRGLVPSPIPIHGITRGIVPPRTYPGEALRFIEELMMQPKMSEQSAALHALLRDELDPERPQKFSILYFDQEKLLDGRDIRDLVRGIFASGPARYMAGTDDGSQAGELTDGNLPSDILERFIRTSSGSVLCSLQYLAVFSEKAEFSIGADGYSWTARLTVDGPYPHTVIDPHRYEECTGWYRSRLWALRRNSFAWDFARGGALIYREYFTSEFMVMPAVEMAEQSGTNNGHRFPESALSLPKTERICGILDKQQYQALLLKQQ